MPQEQPQNIPVPDPTRVTMEQIDKAVECVRELIFARLDSIEKRLEMLQSVIDERQDTIDKTVAHLHELHNEKFASIQIQFGERDTRIDKTAELNQKAIDAALQAAEKAVGKQTDSSALASAKSETAITKQIDLQAALLQTETKGLYAIIDDIKTRLTTIDGRGSGMATIWGYIIGAFGAIAAVVAIIVTLSRT